MSIRVGADATRRLFADIGTGLPTDCTVHRDPAVRLEVRIQPELRRYPPSLLWLLLDEQASERRIIHALSDLAASVRPDNIVVCSRRSRTEPPGVRIKTWTGFMPQAQDSPGIRWG